MGVNTSSELKVNFSRPSLFYFAGEQVSGNVSFQSTEEKLTIDGIYLECIGEIGFTSEETRQIRDDNGNVRNENYTEDHTIPCMNIRVPVAQPQYGQREIILYRGQHSWPFEFVLPQYLPPSLRPATASNPYVKYYARIILDKPWYKPNARQTYPLTIFPRVNIFYTPGGQQPVAFQNQNRKKIRLQGYLIRGGVVPGDKLTVQIDIQNPKQVVIKKIEATLIQHRQVGRSNYNEAIFRLDIPNIQEFSGISLRKTFELLVPSVYLSPTYTYLLQQPDRSVGVVIQYDLLLDVKVRGLFTDFKISVPVIVGTEPISPEQLQQQQQVNTPIQMPIASAPAMEYDELPPPSYESVVSAEKS